MSQRPWTGSYSRYWVWVASGVFVVEHAAPAEGDVGGAADVEGCAGANVFHTGTVKRFAQAGGVVIELFENRPRGGIGNAYERAAVIQQRDIGGWTPDIDLFNTSLNENRPAWKTNASL